MVLWGCERQRDHACKLYHTWVEFNLKFNHCPSEVNNMKAKVNLCGQVQSTRNYSSEDMSISVQGARPPIFSAPRKLSSVTQSLHGEVRKGNQDLTPSLLI